MILAVPPRVTEEESVQSPQPSPPAPPSSWIVGVLRQPLSLLQTLVGILAGLLSIGGAFLSITSVTPAPQGEIVAFVHDRLTRKPIPDATIEILTREDALVTTLSADPGGRLTRRLKEGRYRVRVTHPAFGTEVRQVEVHGGQRSEVPITLARRPAQRVVRTVSTDTPGPVRKFFKDLGF